MSLDNLTGVEAFRWFSLGQSVRRGVGARVPVAYLYNGVRLPDIYKVYTPDVQKEYPFAFIQYYTSLGGITAILFVGNVPMGFVDRSGWRVIGYNELFDRMECDLYAGGASASSPVFGDVIRHRLTTVVPDEVLWANYDVPDYVNGGIILSASDPIPVYE